MRVRILVAFLATLFVAGTGQDVAAQQAERQLEHVAEVHVKPGMLAQFEAGNVARTARMTAGHVSFLTRASASESLVYRFVTPVGDYAGLGRRASEMAGLPAAAAGSPNGNAAIDHVDSYLRWTRPDLSYTPANPRIQGSEWQFIQRVRVYVEQGKMGEAAAVIRDAVALHRQHGSGNAFTVSELGVGADGPALELFFFGTDGADLYAAAAETEAQMGAALQELRVRVAAVSRRIEVTNHTIRRDMGYQPAR